MARFTRDAIIRADRLTALSIIRDVSDARSLPLYVLGCSRTDTRASHNEDRIYRACNYCYYVGRCAPKNEFDRARPVSERERKKEKRREGERTNDTCDTRNKCVCDVTNPDLELKRARYPTRESAPILKIIEAYVSAVARDAEFNLNLVSASLPPCTPVRLIGAQTRDAHRGNTSARVHAEKKKKRKGRQRVYRFRRVNHRTSIGKDSSMCASFFKGRREEGPRW